jgi:hypothetical protein
VYEWLFGVTSPQEKAGKMSLQISGVDRIPQKYFVYICDKGKFTDMRLHKEYPCSTYYSTTYYSVIVTDDPDYLKKIPLEYSLEQNYPNPFNPATAICFSVPMRWRQDGLKIDDAVPLKLFIYNLNGQVVKKILDRPVPYGYYRINWNGEDGNGRKTASGFYVYRLYTQDFCKAKKMILLK